MTKSSFYPGTDYAPSEPPAADGITPGTGNDSAPSSFYKGSTAYDEFDDITVSAAAAVAAAAAAAASAAAAAVSAAAAAADVATATTALTAHLADTDDAHDASAVSFAPAGNIVATTVQAALEELDDEALHVIGSSIDNYLARWSGVNGDTLDVSPMSVDDNGLVTATGAQNGFVASDRTGAGIGVFYRNAGVNALWDGDYGDVIQFGADGVVKIVNAAGLQVGASLPFSDAAGVLTLQNIDALDATTEATIEAAIDTLANLTSIQGRTVTLADAGANAILGWDDVAGAYENLTQGEVHGVIGTLPVANGGTGQATEAEAIGEMVQALTADATPDWAADYIPSYDASADTGKKLLLSTVWREKLVAARTYYVRTDGSDSNTGLVDSAGGAFLTIQKAMTTVGGLDFAGQTVTISVADGTYTAGFDFVSPWVGGGHLILEGDTTTPANALVDIATGDVFKISVPPPGTFTIRGFKLDTPDGTCINHVSTGTININNINFATTTSWQMAATAPGGVISSIGGSLTISGSAGAFILAFGGGSFLIQGSTITLTGTPAFSVAFVWATRTGFISADGITFSGSATGTRYLIDAGGTIYTSGGGATYFPGNSAGSGGTTTGGGFYS
jgi:hypothetical protein